MQIFLMFTLFLIFPTSTTWANNIGTFKLINGSFKYSSSQLSGASSSMGSPSVGLLMPVTEVIQIGGSFDIFFNTASQSVSLYGFGLIGKYSFIGQGFLSINEINELKISTATKTEVYLLSSFKRYTYFLGSNKTDETKFDQTGDFFNFDIGLGSSYDIGNRIRINGEVTTTLFSLASSDNRIKFKSTLLSIGLQREF